MSDIRQTDTNFPGIVLQLLADDIVQARDELRQVVQLQRIIGWRGEEVPTHTLRSFNLGTVTGLVDLGYVLLAKDRLGQVVGFARVARAGDGVHYLHELAVAKDVQLKGLGGLLMEGVVAHSQKKGAKELWFTFNVLNPRNAFFYIGKCGAEVRRFLPDFYGKPVDGQAYSVLAVMDISELSSHPGSESFSDVPVVAEVAQFVGQDVFKVPAHSQTVDFLPHNHDLVILTDGLLVDLLDSDRYAITGFQRGRTPFWVLSSRKT